MDIADQIRRKELKKQQSAQCDTPVQYKSYKR